MIAPDALPQTDCHRVEVSAWDEDEVFFAEKSFPGMSSRESIYRSSTWWQMPYLRAFLTMTPLDPMCSLRSLQT